LPVLDADIYARVAVQIGSPVLKAIALRCGEDILLPDGTLNRRQLQSGVFSVVQMSGVGFENKFCPYIAQIA